MEGGVNVAKVYVTIIAEGRQEIREMTYVAGDTNGSKEWDKASESFDWWCPEPSVHALILV